GYQAQPRGPPHRSQDREGRGRQDRGDAGARPSPVAAPQMDPTTVLWLLVSSYVVLKYLGYLGWCSVLYLVYPKESIGRGFEPIKLAVGMSCALRAWQAGGLFISLSTDAVIMA